jgi:hypothetical protein
MKPKKDMPTIDSVIAKVPGWMAAYYQAHPPWPERPGPAGLTCACRTVQANPVGLRFCSLKDRGCEATGIYPFLASYGFKLTACPTRRHARRDHGVVTKPA